MPIEQPLANSTNRITWTATDHLGVAMTGLTVTTVVTDPDGTVQLNGVSLSHEGGGTYVYIMPATKCPKVGVYTVRIIASTGGTDPIHDSTQTVGFRGK